MAPSNFYPGHDDADLADLASSPSEANNNSQRPSPREGQHEKKYISCLSPAFQTSKLFSTTLQNYSARLQKNKIFHHNSWKNQRMQSQFNSADHSPLISLHTLRFFLKVAVGMPWFFANLFLDISGVGPRPKNSSIASSSLFLSSPEP